VQIWSGVWVWACAWVEMTRTELNSKWMNMAQSLGDWV
jgi:hypothetical protein